MAGTMSAKIERERVPLLEQQVIQTLRLPFDPVAQHQGGISRETDQTQRLLLSPTERRNERLRLIEPRLTARAHHLERASGSRPGCTYSSQGQGRYGLQQLTAVHHCTLYQDLCRPTEIKRPIGDATAGSNPTIPLVPLVK